MTPDKAVRQAKEFFIIRLSCCIGFFFIGLNAFYMAVTRGDTVSALVLLLSTILLCSGLLYTILAPRQEV